MNADATDISKNKNKKKICVRHVKYVALMGNISVFSICLLKCLHIILIDFDCRERDTLTQKSFISLYGIQFRDFLLRQKCFDLNNNR